MGSHRDLSPKPDQTRPLLSLLEQMALNDLESEAVLEAGAERLSATSLVRRGPVECARTQGGHRRFPLAALRKLAAERGARALVRPLAPPSAPLPALADVLSQHGEAPATAAASSLYRGGAPGWFADEKAAAARDEWLLALVRACQSGGYADALQASGVFLRRAHLQAAALLERHSYVERFGRAALQTLARTDAPQGEMAAARRLFAALQQAHLDCRT